VRGVSGGQRHRVTLAEAFCTRAGYDISSLLGPKRISLMFIFQCTMF
jgi:hypothetical protein